MQPTSPLPQVPFLIYLDANPLVYWMLPTSSNPNRRSQQDHARYHSAISTVLAICGRYTSPQAQISVFTSQWALSEVHSALYREELFRNGIGRRLRDPRKQFPPDSSCLLGSTTLLERKMTELSRNVILVIDQPAMEVWGTALSIAQQCGIYAPDSLHLATAIHRGCNLFVTQDVDFLNKIHHFQSTVIAQILQGLPTIQGTPPTFEACPLVLSPGLHGHIATVAQYLAQMGYT